MAFDTWAMCPQELSRSGLGPSGDGLFAALHRPWRWRAAGPNISERKLRSLSSVGLELPGIQASDTSIDGSTKLLLSIGDHRIEAVHMPRQVSSRRVTICLSSQVGCAMGCTFCATSQIGFVRQLSAGEIVAQLLAILHRFGPRHPSDLTLVFMGMGEPLHNLRNVARAIEVFRNPLGLGLSSRRITVSTSGLVPEIRELAQIPERPMLAVSLNATTDASRCKLMPIGRRYSLPELKATLLDYPLRKGERIMLEYVLIDGINDSSDDAKRLREFSDGLYCHINLIPYNPHRGAVFRAPDEAALDQFARELLKFGPTVITVRRSRGADIDGACGQLAAGFALMRRNGPIVANTD